MKKASSRPKFLIATSNPGKFDEILEVVGNLPFEFFSLKNFEENQKNSGLANFYLNHNFEEDGETFEENALKKARHYFGQAKIMTLGEDSGILVDALQGELGVKTRRWGAGEKASDEEWMEYFFCRMEDVPLKKRTARFVCCAVFIDQKGEAHIFRGESEGVITFDLEAPIKKGIPLSSCFRPHGYSKVFAALSVEEKNKISHRGRAMKFLRAYLENYSPLLEPV